MSKLDKYILKCPKKAASAEYEAYIKINKKVR